LESQRTKVKTEVRTHDQQRLLFPTSRNLNNNFEAETSSQYQLEGPKSGKESFKI